MTSSHFDLFVIGGGSGGVRAARVASQFGARVALCEKGALGGTCVNVGCIPKKLFSYASRFSHDFQDAAAFGWSIPSTTFDWQTLLENKNLEIARLNEVYDRLLTDVGVTVIRGEATLSGAQTIQVGDATYTAEHILVATGSWPFMPDMPGVDLAVTSTELFSMQSLPQTICVVGGGYIGVEFAGVFQGLGVDVTLVQRGPELLTHFDADVREHFEAETRKKGIVLHLGTKVVAIRELDGVREIHLDCDKTLEAEMVLCATGRRPNTRGLGLDRLDVDFDERGAIKVDDEFRSSVPSIRAVGDVIDRFQLTPVALAEGTAVAHMLFGPDPFEMDYGCIPTAIFSDPPIATVGLTEEQARETYGKIQIYRTAFTSLKLVMTDRNERTMMKLIVDAESDRVVGCHMVGSDSPEIVQGLAIALKAGATKADFDRTIGIHPTVAEELVTMRTPDA